MEQMPGDVPGRWTKSRNHGGFQINKSKLKYFKLGLFLKTLPELKKRWKRFWKFCLWEKGWVNWRGFV